MIDIMSRDFQTVVLADNLKGFGYRPDFTPAHHDERLIGINRSIWLTLSNPVSGRFCNSGIFESFDICCPPLLIFGQHTEVTIRVSGLPDNNKWLTVKLFKYFLAQ